MDLYPIAILCGGKGTRLGEKTAHCPKSLVPIAGKPFIVHQLRLLERAGFRDVFLLVQYLGYQFLEAGLEGRFPSLHLRYLFEGDQPLGTAGAVRQALPYLPECFFTLYGDSYPDVHFGHLQYCFWTSEKAALVTNYDGVDYGVSVFDRAAFQADELMIPSVHQRLRQYDALVEVEIPYCWHEMGSPDGFARLERHLLEHAHA